MAFLNATPLASRSARVGRTRTTHPTRSPRRNATRMIAAEPKAPTKLSNRAAELISYLGAHKSIFRPGRGFNSGTATFFRKNDTGSTFAPLDELATNAHMLPAGSVAASMVVQLDDLLEKCYQSAVSKFPTLENDQVLKDIFQNGIRSVLRIISYGAACQTTDFIHENNLGMLKLLHEEVGFPTGLVADSVRVAKDEVLAQVNDASLVEKTAECFDVVATFMS